MDDPVKILMVEDSVTDAELVLREIHKKGIRTIPLRVDSDTSLLEGLADFNPDIIISDYTIPGFSGIHALQIANQRAPEIPFIFVSGTIGEERAVEALRHGATDYILKGNLTRLVPALTRALEERREKQKTAELDAKIERLSRINNILTSVNAAIIRNHTRHALYRETVRIATEQGKLRLAWVAETEPKTGVDRLVAWSGISDNKVAHMIVGTPDPGAAAIYHPTRQALQTGTSIAIDDVATDPLMDDFRSEAIALGYRSLIAIPLTVEGTPIAALALGAEDPNSFSAEECRLINELAQNISFALEHIAAQEKLQSLAYYDPLTGSANRTLLKDRLGQAIAHAKRVNCQVAVIFIDLDHFKYINDSLGHDAGDALLRTIAQRMQTCLRDGDTLARMGGDEFVVVLSDQIDEAAINQVTRRLVAAIGAPVAIADREIRITCSIGISVYPGDGRDEQTLMRNADAAMYQAKAGGRDSFHFFTQELNTRINHRMSLESDLHRAIKQNEFFVEYQPQFDLSDMSISGAEALIRWRHPELGLVAPPDFIPLAEETGLIEPIGEWVLRTVCRQIKNWHENGLPALTVSVNLSARQFRRTHLDESIRTILYDSGLAPHFLGLELTESLVMQDAEAGALMLKKLKQMGMTISIDDFGTGYSSLGYLKRFPVNVIKIDQSFVRGITEDPDDAMICRAIIALAHGLDLQVVAEGVETEAQLALLRAIGCDRAQGYLFSRPLSAEKFPAYKYEPPQARPA